jgi:hypothetical protein
VTIARRGICFSCSTFLAIKCLFTRQFIRDPLDPFSFSPLERRALIFHLHELAFKAISTFDHTIFPDAERNSAVQSVDNGLSSMPSTNETSNEKILYIWSQKNPRLIHHKPRQEGSNIWEHHLPKNMLRVLERNWLRAPLLLETHMPLTLKYC